MKTKEEWEDLRLKATLALRDIENKERQAELSGEVGKCYRFRNSYGSGSGNKPWWLYVKVVAIEGGFRTAFKFETTDRDEIQIEPSYAIVGMTGYEPISAMDFSLEWQRLLERLASL